MDDEFKFEREIRNDEERIATYFAALPYFIDLPGEEEAIFERISKNENVKVSSSDGFGSLRRIAPDWDFGVNEDDEDSEFCYSPGYDEIPGMIDSISVLLSEQFAYNNSAVLENEYLPLLCQCSKVMSRISDLIFGTSAGQAMHIALAKRSLNDINYFAAMLQRSNIPDMSQISDILQSVRNRILNIIFELQKN